MGLKAFDFRVWGLGWGDGDEGGSRLLDSLFFLEADVLQFTRQIN